MPTVPYNAANETQVTTNESYVSVLNHCFDDIEKFIIRLQHAYAAMRELQAKRRQSKKSSHQQSALATAGDEPAGHKSHSSSNGQQQQPAGLVAPAPPLKASDLALLSSRARGPNAEDFFEILSKFKLAFNLLAKLKGCIHEPNAPELVHFLFTPLAIIIESARNGKYHWPSRLPSRLPASRPAPKFSTRARPGQHGGTGGVTRTTRACWGQD